MPTPPAPLLLIVDGNAILHRAFHALPAMTAPDGRVVHAAYGFLTVFFKALADLAPTHVAVTFDLPGGTFRNELFPEYQAQREEKPDDLYAQIPMIKDVLAGLCVPVYEAAGFEADDVMGTIVEKVRGKREEGRGAGLNSAARVIVLTGDKDLLQLVRDGVEVVLLRRGMTDTGRYDRDAVIVRFGFPPERIPDFKALAGDPSDNYPGVPGVGEKTATELVKALGGVEEILKRVEGRGKGEEWAKPLTVKLAEKLRANIETARLGLRLATIVRGVPFEFQLTDCELRTYDREAVVGKLRELGFTSLLNRLPSPSSSPSPREGEKWDIPPPRSEGERLPAEASAKAGEGVRGGQGEVGLSPEIITDQTAIRKAFADARATKAVALAVVADGDDLRRGHPRSLGMAWDGQAVGIHPWGTALSEGAALLRDETIAKDAHGAKSLLHAFGRSRIELQGLRYDTKILSHLLAPGSRSHDLAHVAFAELGIEVTPPGVILSETKDPVHRQRRDASGDTLSMTSEDEPRAAAERAGREAAIVHQLAPILAQKVADAGLSHVYEDIERPLVPVLHRMEATGVLVDTKALARMSKDMRRELDVADRAIFRHAGEEFNIDSPQQLKHILFEVLGLQVRGIKKTAKGKTLSTAAAELEKLRGSHPIIEHLFVHRELQKLLSTYVDALPTLVDSISGRVHTTYHQTVTATGRLSSSDPNLQNIPVTEPWGPAIRRAFIAEDGWRLLSLDYSQFELRVAAALSGDRRLQQAFQSGHDIHAATGAEVFNVAPKEVTRDQRRVAKAINFGILYGMGATALAATAAVSREEADAYIQRYFAAYSELAEWVETTKALARKRGYVETLFGRKRFLPEIASGVPQVRAAAERMAVNMPIQGTQADLLKLAMIRADDWIRSEGRGKREEGRVARASREERVRMVLTVHDELVFEVREKIAEDAARALTDILEHVHQLPVPIVVDAKVGRSWGELKPI